MLIYEMLCYEWSVRFFLRHFYSAKTQKYLRVKVKTFKLLQKINISNKCCQH